MKTKLTSLISNDLQQPADLSEQAFDRKTTATDLNLKPVYLQPPEAQSPQPAIVSVLKRLWWDVVDSLRVTQEPCVRELVDRTGFTYWRVYDPDSNEFLRFSTDADVVTWLEERHQRRLPPDRWVW